MDIEWYHQLIFKKGHRKAPVWTSHSLLSRYFVKRRKPSHLKEVRILMGFYTDDNFFKNPCPQLFKHVTADLKQNMSQQLHGWILLSHVQKAVLMHIYQRVKQFRLTFLFLLTENVFIKINIFKAFPKAQKRYILTNSPTFKSAASTIVHVCLSFVFRVLFSGETAW